LAVNFSPMIDLIARAPGLKSVDALVTGLVDYAGLFPPAGQDMRPALESYASYLESPDRLALGRFIVPISRLKELEDSGSDLMPVGESSEPWRLAVLVADDVRGAAAEMLEFNDRHSPESNGGNAVVDVVELKASTVNEIAHQRNDLPPRFIAYFEIPTSPDVSPLVKAIATAGARAKIRTGGITPDAFPRVERIVDFLAACRHEGVAFKATAGLHHAVRGDYRLTYESGSPKAMMYGFLNLFMAAALVYTGESEDTAIAVLEDKETSAFTFSDDGIQWREKRIGLEQIVKFRSRFGISFGSCSFREPVDELASLTGRARSTTL
jgi:hypothetical protein